MRGGWRARRLAPVGENVTLDQGVVIAIISALATVIGKEGFSVVASKWIAYRKNKDNLHANLLERSMELTLDDHRSTMARLIDCEKVCAGITAENKELKRQVATLQTEVSTVTLKNAQLKREVSRMGNDIALLMSLLKPGQVPPKVSSVK